MVCAKQRADTGNILRAFQSFDEQAAREVAEVLPAETAVKVLASAAFRGRGSRN
jgi:hypothetical protein